MNLSITKYLIVFCLLSVSAQNLKAQSSLKVEAYYPKQLKVGNGIAFQPNTDVLYFSGPSSEKDKNGKAYYRIYRTKFIANGKWQKPVQVPFSSRYTDYHPVFNPQGTKIFFNSRRPRPDETTPQKTGDIWMVQRQKNGTWGKPVFLPVNTNDHDTYPSVTQDGTLYFNSDRPGGKGSMDFYRATFKNGQYTQPTLMKVWNSTDSENDLAVDPEERFVIFNRYIFATKEVDLFISFRKKNTDKNGKVINQWSKPQPITSLNKKGVWELTPTISPDGLYFYYEVKGVIMQVSLPQLLKSIKQTKE